MKTTFNRDFYATIATVMPVLYLALTVQGPLYSSMLRRAWSGLLRKERDWELSLRLLRVTISVGLIIAAVVILVSGLGGEMLAIFALYNGSGAQAGPWVLSAVIALVVATAVGPFWAFLRLPLFHMLLGTSTEWLGEGGGAGPPPGDDHLDRG